MVRVAVRYSTHTLEQMLHTEGYHFNCHSFHTTLLSTNNIYNLLNVVNTHHCQQYMRFLRCCKQVTYCSNKVLGSNS